MTTPDPIEIRNAVLPILRDHGVARESLMAQNVDIHVARAGGFNLSLWGPFKRSPTSPWPEPVNAALPGPTFHRLIVWEEGFGKVMTLDWDEAEETTLHGFSARPWVNALLAALSTLSPTPIKEA